uniref:Ribonuclease H protein At1g65750 family n=1 Tax=Cajanus cajan TaxID=3821 RepID=A0A151RAH9_CAJCA|nr:Putative ribonuclease H protein At1g65750 family [Cajanus cajan]
MKKVFLKEVVCDRRQGALVSVGWKFPPEGILKLNCDGAVDVNSIAACRGVLRDSSGDFVFAFTSMLGTCSVVQAELWAIFHGLRIINERGISDPIIIESDSALAVKFLNEGCSRENPCYSLVNLIVNMTGNNLDVKCNHIFREANQVADCLAKRGIGILDGIQIFSSPPWVMTPLFADSSNNVIFPRGF